MAPTQHPDFRNAEAINNCNILRQLIPVIWKQVFIAPMVQHGDYDTIGLQSPHLRGMVLKMWKDHLEVDYQGNTWTVSWAVGRPWHVTGGWVFSSNWRKAGDIMAPLISTLTQHALNTTRICQF